MSFLKNIWKNNSKHRKLSEEWALAKNKEIENVLTQSTEDINESETEDVTFDVKYIGSTLVDRATNEGVTAEAIKTILRVAKAAGKKLPRVTVTVSLKGIKISDGQSGKDNEISIYRISYCSADAAHSRVFAFIASDHNETMECHAFLCAKRKQAQAVTLALARSFSMAYEAWRHLPSPANKEKRPSIDNIQNNLPQLIDLGDFDEQPAENIAILLPSPQGYHKNDWVSFDDDNDNQRWKTSQQNDLIC